MEIIGRERERRSLRLRETSNRPEFIAVYGRRRVGKTFLITEHFANKFTFAATGVSGGSMKDNLRAFHAAIKRHFHADIPIPADWFQAFDLLQQQLEQDITLSRKVIFIDEMPWLDTPKSKFILALEYFWNAFASRRADIMLIVCGSAASWIINKLLESYGGLYNRITEAIVVEPFSLSECEAFYRNRGIAMNRMQIAEAYMILGGIPYYMDAMDRMLGFNQNIDLLLFKENAALGDEFNRLYHSLFRHAQNHIRIAETLSDAGVGMTRKELSAKSKVPDGGGLTKVLGEMEACGLIGRNRDYIKKRDGDYYKLCDFFTLFHFKFLKPHIGRDPHFWTNYLAHPAHRAWCGYAFERLCMAHIGQIKQKLGISGVLTETYAFRKTGTGGAQIDIVIDRKDSVINLCECKFAAQPYEITDKDAAELEHKRAVFLHETGTKKAIHTTMITANGLKHNAGRNEIHSEITLNDLFNPAF